MSLYTFVSEKKTESEFAKEYDRLETAYHVPVENFDAVLSTDCNGLRLTVQPWVFDALKAKHPSTNEHSIYVEYYETEYEFDIYAHYEITVVERI